MGLPIWFDDVDSEGKSLVNRRLYVDYHGQLVYRRVVR
jgi:hypothetical protein